MTQNPPTTSTAAPRSHPDLEAVVGLVANLVFITNEATRCAENAVRYATDAARMTREIQAKLPLALATNSATGTTWIRGTAYPPSHWEDAIKDGSGEVWYVVIRGREPGLYAKVYVHLILALYSPTNHFAAASSSDADMQTMGVPNQYREKKKTRREALTFYREQYDAAIVYDNLVGAAAAANTTVAPGINMGVQKWTGLPVGSISLSS
ncbi:hypothetical protein R3P38DRAFT_3175640 [Favolaschia claudopus]|uniref:Uncharacterized protein n=1 Tax=Favolaschia claudopus TaxID=2862362 RepID=A0AAW0D1G2_9AGAR